MSPSNRQPDCAKPEGGGSITVPAGTPDWITVELIEATVRTWQPHYEAQLTTDDAIEIIRNAGRLFDALSIRRGPMGNSWQAEQD